MAVRSFLTCAVLLSATLAAHATPITGSFAVTVSEGLTNGSGFDTANGNPFSGSNSASATFTYTGPIDFDNTTAQNGPGAGGDTNSAFGFTSGNISNYNGSGTVMYNGGQVARYNNKGNFLSSSGSAANYTYGSYYTFDLGNLGAGTFLTITHDDGISIFQNGMQVGPSISGPTSQVTDYIALTSSGDTVLRYARENGTPSILQVSATPEPSSIALLGTGLLGVAGLVRKRLA